MNIKAFAVSFARIALLLILSVIIIPSLTISLIPFYETVRVAHQYEQATDSIVVVINKPEEQEARAQLIGGGIYIGRGNIVTNAHVVGYAVGSMVSIMTADNTNALGIVRYSDALEDIARIEIVGDVPPMLIPATFRVRMPIIGENIFGVGHPAKLFFSFTKGYVMFPLRVSNAHALQANIPSYPGSSGGGIFDENGYVIGMGKSYSAGSAISYLVPSIIICSIPNIHCQIVDR